MKELFPSDGIHKEKKKRITRACEECKRRKRRCDGIQPCSSCKNVQVDCIFTIQAKRGRKKANMQVIIILNNFFLDY